MIRVGSRQGIGSPRICEPGIVALAVTLCLLAVACGGQDDAEVVIDATESTTTSAEDSPRASQGADDAAFGGSGVADGGGDDVATEAGFEAADTDEPPSNDKSSQAQDAVVAGPGDLPDLEMTEVSSNESVNLQSLADGQTPLLLWFWAPH